MTINVEYLRDWIGAGESTEDLLTASLASRFRATVSIGNARVNAEDAPPRLIHFCLCQPAASMDELGEDGHPARGGFLPPVLLPRRMWAGSSIRFHGDLRIGDAILRRSRIADVVMKQGRAGSLCFVTVDHAFSVGGEVRVEDRQTIVYRPAQNGATADAPEAAPPGDRIVVIDPTPPLLFRYSALTFNGHRIHYDVPYATGVEDYPGLVVHGPLQATLLLQLAASMRGRQPDFFSFRSLSTLYAGEPLLLNATEADGGTLSLWTARAGGPIAMRAEARWS